MFPRKYFNYAWTILSSFFFINQCSRQPQHRFRFSFYLEPCLFLGFLYWKLQFPFNNNNKRQLLNPFLQRAELIAVKTTPEDKIYACFCGWIDFNSLSTFSSLFIHLLFPFWTLSAKNIENTFCLCIYLIKDEQLSFHLVEDSFTT